MLSFALIGPLGLAGVIAATVVAHIIMWIGRARVVIRHYLPGYGWRYLGIQIAHLATLGLGYGLTRAACAAMPGGWPGMIAQVVVVCLIPNAVNLAAYGWTSDAAYLRERAKAALGKLRALRKGGQG